MSNFLKKIYAFPFFIGVCFWLATSGFFAYLYFCIFGFNDSKVRSFLCFQGRIVQVGIFFVSGFNKTREKKPLLQKPAILVANHTCSYDTFIFSDFRIKNLVCIAKGWVFRIPIYGKLIKKAGYINSDNKTTDEIISQVKERFAKGIHIGVFPEGTRNKKIGRFRSLAFAISIKTNSMIVPFVIKGLDNMLPKGTYFPKKSSIAYVQLDAVSPEQFNGEAGALKMAQYVKGLIVEELKNKNI